MLSFSGIAIEQWNDFFLFRDQGFKLFSGMPVWRINNGLLINYFQMDQAKISVDMALKAWNIHIARTSTFFDSLTDDELVKEVAPGKNRAIYLLGHLIAVNDSMISIFGLGERQYAHLDDAFVKNPDKSGFDMPDAQVLRNDWKRSNEVLSAYFGSLSPADWMAKHNSMSEEDYVKEPSRNKLSVLLNRTNHVAYHLGQMRLIK
jgi:DinB family protein